MPPAASHADFISHRIELNPSSPSSPTSSSLVWYPLSHLTRWCGVVAPDDGVNEVKRAMLEAKIGIQEEIKQRKEIASIEDVYRKIGNVVSVSSHNPMTFSRLRFLMV